MTELSERGDQQLPVPTDWTYAPAPESTDIVTLAGALRPLHRRQVGRAALGRVLHDDLAARRGSRSPRSHRRAPRTSHVAVAAAREAFTRLVEAARQRAREVPLPDRADPPGARARVRGARVAERRQADQGVARRRPAARRGALLLLRRLGRQARVRLPEPAARPLGVAGQIIPWNFPLLMLAWKIAPALAGGNTVVLKPAETTPLTALLFCDVSARRSCRRASSTSSPATARRARRSSTPRSTRSRSPARPRSARRSSAGSPARGKKLTLELGGKAANIVFDDAALDQAVEGIVNGIYFNQGHVCCAGSRLFVQESIYEPVVEKLKRRMATLRVGDPLDKNTDVGAINSKPQLEKIKELVAGGSRRGRRDLPAAVPAAREGLLVRADGLHERRAELPDRAGGDLRAGALGAHLPHAGGGGREGEQHALRALGRRLDREGLADPLDGPAAAGRRRLGEHVQPVRPDQPVRRLQGVRLRPRGRPARARALPR